MSRLSSASAFILSAMLAAAVPAAAKAADLPYENPYYGQNATAGVYDWTGFYVGAHAGGGWGSAGSTDLWGYAGGIQGGYAMQQGQFVMGLEGDIGFAGIDGSKGAIDASIDSLGSARVRVGVALDQFLLYGTGGFGFGDVEVSDPISRDDQWRLGWVLGIGAEAQLSRNWTARVEAFHYDLGSASYVIATGARRIDVDANVVRAGVNYRF
jgi:outer membrane immunogenic protein